MISKGVEGNSVSERRSGKEFWGWSLMRVVLGVRVAVLVGLVFKEGVIGIGFKLGRCKIRQEI